MDREIKFKAWSTTKKAWLQDSEYSILMIDLDGNLNKVQQDSCETPYREVDNFILVQYTGLKDKNNKDIYCGDVVKVFDWGIRSKEEVIGIGEVYWDDEDAGWGIKSIKENEYILVEDRYDLFNKATFEIIGNIYEQIP